MDTVFLPALNAALTLLGQRSVGANDPSSRATIEKADTVLPNVRTTVSRDLELIRPRRYFEVGPPIGKSGEDWVILGGSVITIPDPGIVVPPDLPVLISLPDDIINNYLPIQHLMDDCGNHLAVGRFRWLDQNWLALPADWRGNLFIGAMPKLTEAEQTSPLSPFTRLFHLRLAHDLAITLGKPELMGSMLQLYKDELRQVRQTYARRNGNGFVGYYGANAVDPSVPPQYVSWLNSRS